MLLVLLQHLENLWMIALAGWFDCVRLFGELPTDFTYVNVSNQLLLKIVFHIDTFIIWLVREKVEKSSMLGVTRFITVF